MHILNTDLIPVKLPTQIVAECFNTRFNQNTRPTGVAMISVEIDGEDKVFTVETSLSYGINTGFDNDLHSEWRLLMENNEKALRTVTVAAVPNEKVPGTAILAVRQIDLRTEDGDERFFVEVIQ